MSAQATSWWDVINKQLQSTPTWLSDVFAFGLIAAAVGFVAKLFGRYILYFALAIGLVVWLFNSYDLLTLNMYHIKSLFGLQNVSTIDDAVRMYFSWMQTHKVATISGIIGFTFGWKFGG
jgi:ABC-type antimicrobial peptide transport system permease subunit